MLGKILIVDAIATNRIVLKVKLASAFYEVIQAGTAQEALARAISDRPDMILTALTLPQDGDAAGLCRSLGRDPRTQHIPVMAIGAAEARDARLAALQAGVQEVICRPFEDVWLLGRVRSLIRAQNASADWRLRDETRAAFELAEPAGDFAPQTRIVLVCADAALAQGWRRRLRPQLRAQIDLSHGADMLTLAQNLPQPDAFVLVQPADPGDGALALRLISALRAHAATRHSGVVVVQAQSDPALAAQALDLGADDVMIAGFDPDELAVRLCGLMQRKRQDARLRDTYRTGLKAAVFDPLTGLHNRRYAMPDLARIEKQAQSSGAPFAVMLADLDHFKRINDLYGHTSGDAVLVEVAARLRSATRSSDLLARIGGEEFLIVMPATTLEEARASAVRLCEDIGARPFHIPGKGSPIPVTISIGMAVSAACTRGQVPSADLLERADKALYSAKTRGRNRVRLSRPAA